MFSYFCQFYYNVISNIKNVRCFANNTGNVYKWCGRSHKLTGKTGKKKHTKLKVHRRKVQVQNFFPCSLQVKCVLHLLSCAEEDNI